MRRPATRQSYQHRIQAVVAFIADNLHQDLDVVQLAEIANFSPYHFHRVYREMMNETLNATVRRLRLQYAAHRLISSEQPVTSIAKQIGYGSVEAFSRAFAAAYTLSPAKYRQARHHTDVVMQQARLAEPLSENYSVEMIDMPITELVGLPHQGCYLQIGSAFEHVFVQANTAGWSDQHTRSIGLYFDDPQSTPEHEQRSAACITYEPMANIDGFQRYTIPSGRCATVLFQGPYAELERPYSWLFGEWLPQSGLEPADFPPFEEYINDPRETPPSELLTRIHCLVSERD